MYTSWKQKYIELMYPIDGKKINIEEAKILKQDNIPTSLYKYRSFDKNGYSIEILEKNKIYLSTPEEFNDPYDCSLSVMIQELTSYNDKIWKVYYDVGMSKEEVVELKSNNDFDYELTKMFLIKSKEYCSYIVRDLAGKYLPKSRKLFDYEQTCHKCMVLRVARTSFYILRRRMHGEREVFRNGINL